MSWYEDIENKLEALNNTDIEITIDDIDEESIQFCVYDEEVTEEVIDVIEQTLDFIKNDDINLYGISHYPSKNGSAESFRLYYKIDVGEDEKSEDELYQTSLDDAAERKSDFNNMSRGGLNDPSL